LRSTRTVKVNAGSESANRPGTLTLGSPARAIARSQNANAYKATTTNLVPMAFNMLALTGGDQSHNNRQPYLTLSFCIALQGVFPPRG
jgi:microcystin-dependent protein